MSAEFALEAFLTQALATKEKRYIGFASKPKTQSKFLCAINHELQMYWDRSKIVSALPKEASSMKGYLFEPPMNSAVRSKILVSLFHHWTTVSWLFLKTVVLEYIVQRHSLTIE